MGKKVSVGLGSHHCSLWRAPGVCSCPAAPHCRSTAPTTPTAAVHIKMADYRECHAGAAGLHPLSPQYQQCPAGFAAQPYHLRVCRLGGKAQQLRSCRGSMSCPGLHTARLSLLCSPSVSRSPCAVTNTSGARAQRPLTSPAGRNSTRQKPSLPATPSSSSILHFYTCAS